jgi:hypothetical protein
VHIVGVSSLAAAHLTLVPELKAALEEAGPRRHHDRRRRRDPAAGFRCAVSQQLAPSAIFPPGTVIADAARKAAGRAQSAPRLHAEERGGVIRRASFDLSGHQPPRHDDREDRVDLRQFTPSRTGAK